MSTPPEPALDLRTVASTYWQPAPELVGKLPRITCTQCRDAQSKVCKDHKKSQCKDCHQWITERHIHLDYVGHVDVGRTLTEIDPGWTWEPLAFDDQGMPVEIERRGTIEMWGRLTLLGKPMLCVGSCESKKTDVAKELIGDLIRNGAMRHNVFGGLWSKAERDAEPVDTQPQEPLATAAQTQQFVALAKAAGLDKADRAAIVKADTRRQFWKDVTATEADELIAKLKADGFELAQEGSGRWIAYKAGQEPFELDGGNSQSATSEPETGSSADPADTAASEFMESLEQQVERSKKARVDGPTPTHRP